MWMSYIILMTVIVLSVAVYLLFCNYQFGQQYCISRPGTYWRWAHTKLGIAFVFGCVLAPVPCMLLLARWTGWMGTYSEEVCACCAFAIEMAYVTIAAFAIRRHKWRRLQQRLDVAKLRCTRCRYPIRGLSVRHGRVRCPECGDEQRIRDIVRQYGYEKWIHERGPLK